jgi:phosphoketolase
MGGSAKIVPKLTEMKTMLTLEMAIQKIQQFSPEQRNKVIEYIEFLEFQAHREQENQTDPDDEISACDPDFAEMMEITDRGIEKYRNALIELAK